MYKHNSVVRHICWPLLLYRFRRGKKKKLYPLETRVVCVILVLFLVGTRVLLVCPDKRDDALDDVDKEAHKFT